MTAPERELRERLAWDCLDGGAQVAQTRFGEYSVWTDGCLCIPGQGNRYLDGGIEAAKRAAAADFNRRETTEASRLGIAIKEKET